MAPTQNASVRLDAIGANGSLTQPLCWKNKKNLSRVCLLTFRLPMDTHRMRILMGALIVVDLAAFVKKPAGSLTAYIALICRPHCQS